jgi:hypothetical protein
LVSSMAGRISMGARREVVSAVTERYPQTPIDRHPRSTDVAALPLAKWKD